MIVVVAVGGFVAYNNLGEDDDDGTRQTSSAAGESSQEAEQEAGFEKKVSTLKELFARGESMRCTYSYTDTSGNASSGMAYFANERMFGDFTVSQVDGTVLQSNVLKVDEVQYVWSNDAKQGYKASIADVSSDNDTNTNGPNEDEEYEFDCQPWSVDNSLFEVPADVEFTDTTELLQGLGASQQQAAAACAKLEGQSRVACEQAVGAQ